MQIISVENYFAATKWKNFLEAWKAAKKFEQCDIYYTPTAHPKYIRKIRIIDGKWKVLQEYNAALPDYMTVIKETNRATWRTETGQEFCKSIAELGKCIPKEKRQELLATKRKSLSNSTDGMPKIVYDWLHS